MIDQSSMTTQAEAATTATRTQSKKMRAAWITRLTSPFQTIVEFMQLTKRTGRAMWLVPMMGVLILLAVLLVVIQVIEYVAPFVYTIF